MHPGTTGIRSGTRTHITFRPRIVRCARALLLLLCGVLIRECECKVRGAKRKVRGRVVVLDWAGELDRRSQGVLHLHGLLRHLLVLKLWAGGSASVDGG